MPVFMESIREANYDKFADNRFLQPGVDIEQLAVVSGVHLSSPADARVPRTWIAALRRQTKASLAASSGVESAADAIAHLLAGADVAQRVLEVRDVGQNSS